MHEITADIIQGSAIGPASYIVTADDLCSVTGHPRNSLCQYAYDTYIIISAENVRGRMTERENVEVCACSNNLCLRVRNVTKCVEIVFFSSRTRHVMSPPSLLPDITRVSSVKVLEVTFSRRLSVADHVQNAASSCVQTLYALRLLLVYGLSDAALQMVYRAVVVAKLPYAVSAW